MEEDLIDTFAPPFIHESANRAVTQKKFSSPSRFIIKTLWIETFMNTPTSK